MSGFCSTWFIRMCGCRNLPFPFLRHAFLASGRGSVKKSPRCESLEWGEWQALPRPSGLNSGFALLPSGLGVCFPAARPASSGPYPLPRPPSACRRSAGPGRWKAPEHAPFLDHFAQRRHYRVRAFLFHQLRIVDLAGRIIQNDHEVAPALVLKPGVPAPVMQQHAR